MFGSSPLLDPNNFEAIIYSIISLRTALYRFLTSLKIASVGGSIL